MKVKIIKVTSGSFNWYEVRVKILGFLWIGGDVYRAGFPTFFYSFDEAMCRLDDLKGKKIKKELCCVVKI